MIEQLAVACGRRLHVRGVGRVLSWLYPCRTDSTRYVRGVRRRADGLFVDLDSRELIDWQMLFHGQYEPHLGALFQKFLGPGGLAVDVGANVGAHTLTLARLVGRSGRVAAFEPNPPSHSKLKRNLALNGFDQVHLERCALGAVAGTAELRVPRRETAESANPGIASLRALETPHDLVTVPVQRFDSTHFALSAERIDLVKVDVQGFEQAVFEGMQGALRRHMPVVVFEYEEWAWKLSGSRWDAVVALFKACGYDLFRFIEGQVDMSLALCADREVSGHLEVVALTPTRARRLLPRMAA